MAQFALVGGRTPPPPLPLDLRACTATPITRPCSTSSSGLTGKGVKRDPQSQEVACLTTELARQQELLALLVDRVAPTPTPTPRQAAVRLEPTLQEPGEAVGRDAVNDALLGELFLLKTAVAGRPALPTPEEDAAETGPTGGAPLPLARLAPPLSAFDPEEDVTQAGAESFWAWLDATPRTPWIAKAP